MDIENFVDRALNWSNNRLTGAVPLGDFGPRVDILETDQNYIIKADMPGVDQESLSVKVDGDLLTIQGRRRHDGFDENTHMHRLERLHGSFSRSFSLPTDVEDDSVAATYKDGELTVSLAKTNSHDRPTTVRIPVSVSE